MKEVRARHPSSFPLGKLAGRVLGQERITEVDRHGSDLLSLRAVPFELWLALVNGQSSEFSSSRG